MYNVTNNMNNDCEIILSRLSNVQNDDFTFSRVNIPFARNRVNCSNTNDCEFFYLNRQRKKTFSKTLRQEQKLRCETNKKMQINNEIPQGTI